METIEPNVDLTAVTIKYSKSIQKAKSIHAKRAEGDTSEEEIRDEMGNLIRKLGTELDSSDE